MKKLFLTVAVAMMATTAFSAKWAVVGAYTNPNWNFEASTVLEGLFFYVKSSLEFYFISSFG